MQTVHAAGGKAPSGGLPGPGYELLFEDNFSKNEVDRVRWNYRTGHRPGLNIDALNLERNVSQKNGLLIVKNDVEVIDGRAENTGGGLITKGLFGYGYYEARVKPFMGGKGLHSAFWQRGVSEPGFANTIFEIDGFEIDSPRPHTTHNLYIVPNRFGRSEIPWPHRANMPVELDADGWFINAFDYGPDGVKFYQNGKLVAKATYPIEFPELIAQQNVWLTALNGVGEVSIDKQPGYSYFDYFRYYAKTYPGVNILPNGGFEYNGTKVELQTPVAWRESKDRDASLVVETADAKSGRNVLRHGTGAKFTASTSQTLEHLRDGKYQLDAWVRTSAGSPVSRIEVESGKGKRAFVKVPSSSQWTRVQIKNVVVTGHQASIRLETAGEAAQWVEFDGIRFMAAGEPRELVHPEFNPEVDPIWRIFEREPVDFNGEDKFYFFARNVGLGPSISVAMQLQADRLQESRPMMRAPKKGKEGWAVGLSDAGSAYCLIGGAAEHAQVVSPRAYEPGRTVSLACIYDRGRVTLYVDGKEAASRVTEGFGTNDTTAAGRLGATVASYDAIGDVTVSGKPSDIQDRRAVNFSGKLSRVAVYNRALTPKEIEELALAR